MAVGSEKQGRRLGRGGKGWGVWVGLSGAGRGGADGEGLSLRQHLLFKLLL